MLTRSFSASSGMVGGAAPGDEGAPAPEAGASTWFKHPVPLPVAVMGVAFAYYLGARFGLALRLPPSVVVSLWPPNTILLAALLLHAPRQWPWFLAAFIPAAMAADRAVSMPLGLSLGFAASNALEVITAAAILRRWIRGCPSFTTLAQAWAFLVAAVLAGPGVAAIFSTGLQVLRGHPDPVFGLWRDWFLSAALAQLTLTPTLLIWVQEGPRWLRDAPMRRRLEAVAWCVGLVLICLAGFAPQTWRLGHLPLLAYAPIPFLIWALIRFGAQGACTTLFVTALVAAASASRTQNVEDSSDIRATTLTVQGFLFAFSIPLFFLSALMEERRAAEEALRRSEARYRELVDESPDGIVLATAEGAIGDLNRKSADLLGMDRDQLVGKTLADLVPAEDLQAQPIRIAELRQKGRLQIERRLRRADGQLVTVEINSRVIDGGRILSFLRDVSERKRTEAELRRLVTVVEQSADAILLTDARGRLEYVNPAFERIMGYRAAEVLGHNPALLKSGRQPAAFYDEMWQRLRRGEVWSGTFTNLRKDGVLVEIQATISPIYDNARVLAGFVALEHDITDQVRLEGQLRQAQKMEAIGQLAGGVAHDFNNILTVIRGHLSLLRQGAGSPAELREAIQEIDTAAKRAADLTRQLLAFSRRQVLQRQPLDLNALISDLARMLSRLLGEHIHLRLLQDPNLPSVEADATMIEQVVINLAVNARDAMPKSGTLTLATHTADIDALQASLHKGARPGRYACLSVHDTGTGIPPEALEHIFEPFFTTKDAGQGTGLGLATVYGILDQHRGWAEVTSVPGQGTEFRVYLPPTSKAPAAATRTPAESRTAGQETLLLVEDEEVVRNLLRTYLGRQGYTVVSAQNAPQALGLFRQDPARFALLLTDMVMPGGLSGRDLAEQIHQSRPGLPVVFISGYSLELAAEGLPAGPAVRFLRKPFEPSELGRLIRELLDPPPPSAESV